MENKNGQTIGNTPLIELAAIQKSYALPARLFAKVERGNLGGSIKDRVALAIIEDAEKRGLLAAGGCVVEATSGNTGIGLAAVAAQKGYKAVIVMPDSMSKERQDVMRAFGAELVLTDGALGMQGAVELAKRICTQREGSVLADQFNNPVNPLSHYQSTAPEMVEQMQAMRQKVDIFVCCIGTGGTVSGVGKYIKERYEGARVIGVEPAASPLISKGYAGAHAIQGIGANFIPKTLDRSVLDGVECVSDSDAYAFTKLLKEQENLLCGISSGAALCAAVRLAKREENAGKNIVTIFPDDGGRYLSTGVFD